MKNIKFIIVLFFITTHAVVSGASEPQHPADKPAGPDGQVFSQNRHEFNGYRHLPGDMQSLYDKINHFGDKGIREREPPDYRRPPDNKILSIQRTTPDHRIGPDNKKSLNNMEPWDKRKLSGAIGFPDDPKPLIDIRPNNWDPRNAREPTNIKELPNTLLSYNRKTHDYENPAFNHDLLDNSRPFNDRESNIWEIKDSKGPPVNNGDPHINHQLNDRKSEGNMMRPPLSRTTPENKEPPEFLESINNRNSDHKEPLNTGEIGLVHERRPSDDRRMPDHHDPHLSNRESLYNEESYSVDQTGIRRLHDSRNPLNYTDLSDNRNPTGNTGSPDTKNEDTRTLKNYLNNMDISNSTNHGYDINKINLTSALEKILKENKQGNSQIYIIDNFTTENDKENIKTAKSTQSSIMGSDKSSTNLQDPNINVSYNSVNNIASTSTTFSPSLQVTAVTPAS